MSDGIADDAATGEVVSLFAVLDHVGNRLAITPENVPPLEAFPAVVVPNFVRHATQVGNLNVAEAIAANSEISRPLKIYDIVNISRPLSAFPSLRARYAACKAQYGNAFVGFHRREFCDSHLRF